VVSFNGLQLALPRVRFDVTLREDRQINRRVSEFVRAVRPRYDNRTTTNMNDILPSQTERGPRAKKSASRIVTAILRVLLGLMFLAFGVMGLFNLMKPPADTPQEILTVMRALANAGYLKVVSGAEVLIAVMLLSNRFVPLALAFLAPIVVGILTYHIAMQPATIVPGVVVLAMELYLAWAYRGAFRSMLRAKTIPGGG